jgi:hypothetical protein
MSAPRQKHIPTGRVSLWRSKVGICFCLGASVLFPLLVHGGYISCYTKMYILTAFHV